MHKRDFPAPPSLQLIYTTKGRNPIRYVPRRAEQVGRSANAALRRRGHTHAGTGDPPTTWSPSPSCPSRTASHRPTGMFQPFQKPRRAREFTKTSHPFTSKLTVRKGISGVLTVMSVGTISLLLRVLIAGIAWAHPLVTQQSFPAS